MGNGQRTAMGKGRQPAQQLENRLNLLIDCKERQIIRRIQQQQWQGKHGNDDKATPATTIPFYLFLYQKHHPEDRSNTAITNNTIQRIEEAATNKKKKQRRRRRRRSKGEEDSFLIN
jgi:hypothetical protein